MPTPLRAILHVFQILFLLFSLVMYALLVVHMFDADGIIWDAEYEFTVASAITSVLLAIAFSPGLWSVAKNGTSPQAAGSSAPPAHGQAPPPNYGPPSGQAPPPAGSQAPPPGSGQVPPPPGTYGR